MATTPAATPLRETLNAKEDVRQLMVDLRAAAQDGRMLARRYAELLEKVVEEYCLEFEMRAEAVLARPESQ